MRHIRERFFFWCVFAFTSSAMPLSNCLRCGDSIITHVRSLVYFDTQDTGRPDRRTVLYIQMRLPQARDSHMGSCKVCVYSERAVTVP